MYTLLLNNFGDTLRGNDVTFSPLPFLFSLYDQFKHKGSLLKSLFDSITVTTNLSDPKTYLNISRSKLTESSEHLDDN